MTSCLVYRYFLRPVHTKDNNYKDNNKNLVLKIVLNVKE